MGMDSPAALLDMLAEVASQTLNSEKHAEPMGTNKTKSKSESVRRKAQELSFTLPQLLTMPSTQLVKQFTIFTSDELKRQYSYTCMLIPDCGQRYTSFASEGRARMSIKAHLADHLECLKRDKEAYSTFVATTIKYRNSKTSLQKKTKVQQLKKPQELPNKENKDVKLEKSGTYLRKILSNEINKTETEKCNKIEAATRNKDSCTSDSKRMQEINLKVLGDHSYYEQARKHSTILVKDESPYEKVIENSNDITVNGVCEENIMLMVVESDSVHMQEVPYIAHKFTDYSNQRDLTSGYLSESASWSEEIYAKNMEIITPAKPKGKAKFIGTSKEEREMALELMERIKKKGNPSGGNLQCRICDPPRSFTAPTTLVSHYRSHAGIKPYECRICRAVFTRRHSLKYHMLIHQNQTRFTCADCDKKFRHPSHFREHRRRHTGEAPFGCDDCGQRFKTRNTYKRHLKTRHGKVLTTTGELLHLSEEDFQKVRTNKRRRPENSISENTIDEDVTAPQAIIHFHNDESTNYEHLESKIGEQDYNDEANENVNQQYYHKFGNNNESLENKTDYETEIGVENDNLNYIEGDIKYYNETELERDGEVYRTSVGINTYSCELEIVHGEQTATHDQNCDTHKNDSLYNKLNQEGGSGEYCSETQDDEKQQKLTEYEEDVNYFGGDHEVAELLVKCNQIQRLDEKLDADVHVFANTSQSEQIIEIGDDNSDHGENRKDVRKCEVRMILPENTDNECIFLKDDLKEKSLENGHNHLVRDSKQENINNRLENFVCETEDIPAEDVQQVSNIVHKENYKKREDEDVNVPPSQVKFHCEQKPFGLQLVKNGKLAVFKHAQAFSLIQEGKQNAILLVPNDDTKSNLLRIDRKNIIINGIKALPNVAIPQK
ncbi:uncharacterized protein LOC105695361 isoform X2 [Orussus abietinus]|nr:uncharacterized protein LOC105695361 isoform X2 [Orussus abietinus]